MFDSSVLDVNGGPGPIFTYPDQNFLIILVRPDQFFPKILVRDHNFRRTNFFVTELETCVIRSCETIPCNKEATSVL